MFGYVRARQDTLTPECLASYESAYCGLCHSLGCRRGLFSRMFLSYDFVLLAMLLAPAGEGKPAECRRCPVHPVKGKMTCLERDWLDLAADESVVLTWWKVQDTIADGGSFARMGGRIMSLGLRAAYRKARAACPDFDARVAGNLVELRALEGCRCPSIDQTADCFARLLSAAAPITGDAVRDRALEQLLYHLGRWIYLVDAVDDLAEDQKAGRYNPVACRFPEWGQEEQSYLRRTMDHSLALAGAAFQLLELTEWSPVVENILYSGLPGVEELVFSGQWRDYQKRHRRNDR